MRQIKIVIRAGGTGTRLWPLSTADIPKQFVPVLSDKSLLQEAFERVRVFGVENIFVTTNVRYVDLVSSQLPELDAAHIIAEPLKRNTGPGVAYETAALKEFFKEENPIIISIPSDDFVGNPEAFADGVRAIIAYLENNPEMIVMPLVTPTIVDPGYTYVKSELSASTEIAPITSWIEKPDADVCAQMIAEGSWFAHTGMYMWQLDTAVKMFETVAPDVWKKVCVVRERVASGDVDAARTAANELPIISIESLATKAYANRAGFFADNWNWSDVGKWTVVKDLLTSDDHKNTANHKQVKFVNAENNLVYGNADKRVVLVGVSDLIVVDRGGHLLVCKIDEAHNIGKISEEIQKL